MRQRLLEQVYEHLVEEENKRRLKYNTLPQSIINHLWLIDILPVRPLASTRTPHQTSGQTDRSYSLNLLFSVFLLSLWHTVSLLCICHCFICGLLLVLPWHRCLSSLFGLKFFLLHKINFALLYNLKYLSFVDNGHVHQRNNTLRRPQLKVGAFHLLPVTVKIMRWKWKKRPDR